MVVETGVLVAGAGFAGSAIARALTDRRGNVPFLLFDKAHDEMLVDVILSESGEVAGGLVARRGAVEPVRAPAVVLATGSPAALLPGGAWRLSGDGLAIAHRAGLALSQPVLLDASQIHAGVPCRPDGATPLAGLLVAGSVGSDRPDPAKVARAAIARSREGADAFGPYRQHPTIDAPLPPGFADLKFDRLQRLVAGAASGEAPVDRVRSELRRLKGEADEFCRARVDVPLFSLQNACEVALLLLKESLIARR